LQVVAGRAQVVRVLAAWCGENADLSVSRFAGISLTFCLRLREMCLAATLIQKPATSKTLAGFFVCEAA
jgi:hypothetical protein